MDTSALATLFAQSLSADQVIMGDRLALRDPGYCPNSLAGGVLLVPSTTEEVAAICRIAHENGIGIVAHGGLTGLVLATTTDSGQVAVSFERLNRVLSVDPLQGVMVVEAGVTLQQAIDAASQHGLMPGVDLPSRGSCTIGGMVGTNAGGIQAIRYGMMRDNVLGLQAVLADGTQLDLQNTLVKNNTGYDLKQLFIGAEGTLGLVTRVVLRLHPKPSRLHTALIGCEKVEHLLEVLAQARAHFGGDLVAFESMWPEYFDITSRTPILGSSHAIYGIVETGQWGADQAEDPLTAFLADNIETGLIADGVIAQSDTQRTEIWRTREDSDAVDQVHGLCLSYDVGLRLQDIPPYVQQLEDRIAQDCPDNTSYVFGHLGDGNLHVMVGPTHRGAALDRETVDAIVYGVLEGFEGTTVSAEHGIGLEKRSHLPQSQTPRALDLMKTVKQALDPRGIFNRGKVFEL